MLLSLFVYFVDFTGCQFSDLNLLLTRDIDEVRIAHSCFHNLSDPSRQSGGEETSSSLLGYFLKDIRKLNS